MSSYNVITPVYSFKPSTTREQFLQNTTQEIELLKREKRRNILRIEISVGDWIRMIKSARNRVRRPRFPSWDIIGIYSLEEKNQALREKNEKSWDELVETADAVVDDDKVSDVSGKSSDDNVDNNSDDNDSED